MAVILATTAGTAARAGSGPGPTAPPAGHLLQARPFSIDKAHSILDFTVHLLLAGKTRGSFKAYRGTIMYDEKHPSHSTVSLVIDTSSIDTGVKGRDDDLKGPNFFDVKKYPRIRFESRKIERSGEDSFRVTGTLTMHGTERQVTIPLKQVSGLVTDPFKNERIIFEGSLTLNRKDFGVIGPAFWNRAISEEVDIDLTIGARIFNYNNGFASRKGKSIAAALEPILKEQGAEAATKRFRELKRDQAAEYSLTLGGLYGSAMRAFQSGKAETARLLFELGLSDYPKSDPEDQAQLHAELTQLFARQGDLERALQHGREALKLDPQNTLAYELMRHLEKH